MIGVSKSEWNACLTTDNVVYSTNTCSRLASFRNGHAILQWDRHELVLVPGLQVRPWVPRARIILTHVSSSSSTNVCGPRCPHHVSVGANLNRTSSRSVSIALFNLKVGVLSSARRLLIIPWLLPPLEGFSLKPKDRMATSCAPLASERPVQPPLSVSRRRQWRHHKR